MADGLSPTMTLRDFENGYWYLDQLKHFAERIGIPAAKKLRKDELEKAIVAFLRTAAFLAADKEATRPAAIAAWTELKELDVPKNYASWVKARAQRKRRRIR
jgi:hypothetical protein